MLKLLKYAYDVEILKTYFLDKQLMFIKVCFPGLCVAVCQINIFNFMQFMLEMKKHKIKQLIVPC